MNHTPSAFVRFLHRFLMLKPVSWALSYLLQPADEFALFLTRGKHTIAELVLPTIEVETLGARTGKKRIHPLGGFLDGDKYILIGTNFGRKHHPGWVHNLRAHSECFVHAHGQTGHYIARESDGEERAKYWQLAVSYYKGYAAYEQRAAPRRIAVMVLEPKPT